MAAEKLPKKLKELLEIIAATDGNHEEIAQQINSKKSTVKNNEERLRKLIKADSRVKLVIYYYTQVCKCKCQEKTE